MSGRINETDAELSTIGNCRASYRVSHYIQRLCVATVLSALAGCWQEIEYREPVPSASATAEAAAPQPSATTDSESTEVAASTDSTETDSTIAETDQPSAIEPPPETAPVETPPPETAATTPAATETPAIPTAATVDPAPVSISRAKHVAWMLGSRLSLAALANDRGIAPEDVPKWFEESQLLATELKVPIAPLPEKPAAATGEAASKAVIAYLLDQEKMIGAELEKAGDMEMSALFRLAMRTNLLLVLNTPGSKAVDTISKSIEALGPRTGLPPELWQPLLDMVKQQASPAALRTTVRQMHTDVGRHLARAEL